MENLTFKNKSCQIVIIGSSGTVRNLHRDALKQYGFEKSVTVADIKGVLEILEMETVDWIITPVFSTEQQNSLQLLKLILSQTELRKTFVTFLTRDEDQSYLPCAFDMGLLSYMPERSTKADVDLQYKELFSHFDETSWDLTKTAAIYLRKALGSGRIKEIHSLNQSLLQIFPGDGDLMCHLAESQFIQKDIQAANRTLKQALLIDDQLKGRCEDLKQKFLSGDPDFESISDTLDSSESSPNVLSLDSCMIVEEDQETANKIKNILSDLGIPEINLFPNPQKALAFIQTKKQLGLLITECAFSDMSGFVFIQKLKKHAPSAIILAINNKIEETKDLPLLQELGVMGVLKKPFENDQLIKKVIWLIQQTRIPSEPQAMEFQIREYFLSGQIEKAKGLLGRLFQNPSLDPIQKLRLQAEMSYYNNDYHRANDYCYEALRSGETSVFVLSLLGKSLLKAKDYQGAKRCLELAQSLSPMHIERLCQLSETDMLLGNMNDAENFLNEAKKLDNENPRIKETEAKKNLLEGHIAIAQEIMGEVGCFKEVVAFMNNRAILLSLDKKVSEGVSLYKQAISALPKEREDLITLIYYNLALAYARDDKFAETFQALKKCMEYPSAKTNQKIISLYKRVKNTIEKGERFELQTSIRNPISQLDKKTTADDYLSYISIKRGDLGCHKIYVVWDYPKHVKEALNKTLPFKSRKVIQKK